jgi:phage gp29-like protein
MKKGNIIQKVLSYVPDQFIRIEAFNRNKKGNRATTGIIPEANKIRDIELEQWKRAITAATNPENPNRAPYYDVCDKIKIDSHLNSICETRIQRGVRSKFRVVDEKGDTNEELTALLTRVWFEDWIKYCIQSVFDGDTLIELWDLEEDTGELERIHKVPERHVLWHKQQIAKKVGDEKGESYVENGMDTYYIQIGNGRDLGLNKILAPPAIEVLFIKGAAMLFIDKYGVPYRWAKTDSTDEERISELGEALQLMGPAGWAILRDDETIEHLEIESGSYEVFELAIKRKYSDMSKVVLGQDSTSSSSDSQGNYGSLKVLQEIAEDRHLSDKARVLHLTNKQLLPRLVLLSPVYAQFANHKVEWDETEELSIMQYIEAASKLGVDWELDPVEITQKTGFTILGRRQSSNEDEYLGK